VIDKEQTEIVAIANDLLGASEPVRTTFAAAVSRMLGGLASFPAAWFRRAVQGFEDTTDARSIVAKGLAQAVVEHGKNDPAIMQAAIGAYMPTVVRKLANRAEVLSIAAEEIRVSNATGERAAPLDDDWMNAFMRFSEDASSGRLQLLFGKILAGEIVNPGSFTPATLRAVSELTQVIANDFAWMWGKNIGAEVSHTQEFRRGEGWTKLKRLRDAGLVSPLDAAIYQPEWSPALDGMSPWMVGDSPVFLMVWMLKSAGARVSVINFSGIGMELGSLLPTPNCQANLRALAASFPKTAVARIEMHVDGKVERLWTAN
jgi:hypothetical protein